MKVHFSTARGTHQARGAVCICNFLIGINFIANINSNRTMSRTFMAFSAISVFLTLNIARELGTFKNAPHGHRNLQNPFLPRK